MVCVTIKSLIKLQTSQELHHRIVNEKETKNIGFDREIPKERYISPEKRQKIIKKSKINITP